MNTKKKIINIIVVVICCAFICAGLLSTYFLTIKGSDNPRMNDGYSVFMLVLFIVIPLLFLTIGISNVLTHTEKRFEITRGIFTGLGFCGLVMFAVNLSLKDMNTIINLDYLETIITVCFTLVGFGLTCSIFLITNIIKRVQTLKKDDEYGKEYIKKIILPQFIFQSFVFIAAIWYGMFLIFNLKSSTYGYFKIMLFKFMVYTLAQLVMVIINMFEILFDTIIDKKVKDIQEDNSEQE